MSGLPSIEFPQSGKLQRVEFDVFTEKDQRGVFAVVEGRKRTVVSLQISDGGFRVNAGSLFPGLRRLERDGLIQGEWRVTENNRRAKYYHLTPQGRARLKRETRQWEAQATAIARVLAVTPGQL